MLSQALDSIESYIAYFSDVELPALRKSMRSLAELREHEDHISGRSLAAEVLRDPLLTLRVLIYLASHRHRTQNHDITTIDRAIVMMGTHPFFERFGNLPTVESTLADHPKALVGLLHVIGRSQHAAKWARDFARLRHDIDIDEITVAAMLHEAAEILFWCFAPELMQKISQLKKEKPGLRSSAAQTAVLGVSIHDVQLALVEAWQLPELLISLMKPDLTTSPRVRTVLLACDLARHVANGWDDPALPDDYAAAADLLHMKRSAVMQHIGAPPEQWQPVLAAEIENEQV